MSSAAQPASLWINREVLREQFYSRVVRISVICHKIRDLAANLIAAANRQQLLVKVLTRVRAVRVAKRQKDVLYAVALVDIVCYYSKQVHLVAASPAIKAQRNSTLCFAQTAPYSLLCAFGSLQNSQASCVVTRRQRVCKNRVLIGNERS